MICLFFYCACVLAGRFDERTLYSSHVSSSAPFENCSFINSYCHLYFSIPDLVRYHRWKDDREKQEKNDRNSKLYQKHIEFWQKDLEEYAKKLKEGSAHEV